VPLAKRSIQYTTGRIGRETRSVPLFSYILYGVSIKPA
jgi:hypothetical protein